MSNSIALITWNERLSVKVKAVDEQHQKLVQLLNELHDAMLVGKGQDALGKILDDLLQYTMTHFAFEERLLSTHGYPAFPKHKAMHDALVKQVTEFKERFDKGSIGLSVDMLEFLKSWLVNHIQGVDQAYAPHLHAKGVK